MPECNNFDKPTLAELLEGYADLPPACDSAIRSLRIDSREVQPGDLFAALQGAAVDGRQFVDDAIVAGAIGILVDADQEWQGVQVRSGVPVVAIEGLSQELGRLAARLWHDPSEKLDVIAVTGTNGKTSCTQFIANALNELGQRCGVLGTLGYGLPGDFETATHTTPDAVRVQSLLDELVRKRAGAVALEASSHGLEQGRLNGVAVRTAVFTNLSRDHLDYHRDMEAYGRAKRRLFDFPALDSAVINVDDDFGRELADDIGRRIDVVRYSLHPGGADVHPLRCESSGSGFSLEFDSPWGQAAFESPVLGLFNVSNLLATFSVLGLRGYRMDQVAAAMASLKTVEGRVELVNPGSAPAVVIDYAHTPDALDQVLRALRGHVRGKLWLVFGCGGNRDAGKRPQMGAIAAQLADRVIVTDDNPRRENPDDIVAEILSGMPAGHRAEIEHNRAHAIHRAILAAADEDLVLVAGKGHETYQDIDGMKWPFSDCRQAEQALAERGAA